MKDTPFFLVLDGIDGCGSSTHSKLLKGYLESNGFKVYLTQEPSNSEIGKLLREFLKDSNIPPTTDALMFAADRDLHWNEIKKKLYEGMIVISDRYLESSIIYQSLSSEDISMEWVKTINIFAGKPDLTIILDVDPEISLARKPDQELEKFEDIAFLEKVRSLYLSRAKEEGYHVVNSDDVIEVVQEIIQKLVMEKIKNRHKKNK